MEWPVSDTKLAQIRAETYKDAVMQGAIKYTLDGWPAKSMDVDPVVREFHSVRAHLSVADGLLLYDNRIVIPGRIRRDVLDRIHEGHQGITKCRERAATGVWWPGLTKDITRTVIECPFCQVHQRTQGKEPLVPTPLPEGPWEHVAMDLCDHGGNKYLVVVDFFSRYIEVANLHRDATTDKVILALNNIFARWGFPLCVLSDNGPQFSSSRFEDYAKECGFVHKTSSPHYHQGNGEAERAVQTVKKMLDQRNPLQALMVYRTTPIYATGMSPSQLIMGRQPRTRLPMLARNQEMSVPDLHKVKERDEVYKQYVASHYNAHHNARPLSVLKPDDTVRLKTDEQSKWGSPAKVVGHAGDPAGRSYIVETPQGGRFRRNRRHVQAITEPKENVAPDPEDANVQQDTATDRMDASIPVRRSSRVCKPVERLDL